MSAFDLFLSLLTEEPQTIWQDSEFDFAKEANEGNIVQLSQICRIALSAVGSKDLDAGREGFKRAVISLTEEASNEQWPPRELLLSLFGAMCAENDEVYNCLGWYAVYGQGTKSSSSTKMLRLLAGEQEADEMLARVVAGGQAMKRLDFPSELLRLKAAALTVVERINELAREHKMETRLDELFKEYGIVLMHDKGAVEASMDSVRERSRSYLGFTAKQEILFREKARVIASALREYERGANLPPPERVGSAREYFLALRALHLLLDEWMT